MSLEKYIWYISGHLGGISEFCSGTNYVPLYGADYIPLINNDAQVSLNSYYKGDCKLSPLNKISSWENTLNDLYEKWICKKILDGTLLSNSNLNNSLVESKKNLYEMICETMCRDLSAWLFSIEGYDEYGYENDCLALFNGQILMVIYFGWMD